MAGAAGYRASVYVSAFNGNLVVLRAHRWALDWKVDDFDTTSFINWGIGQYTGGLTDFDLAFDCFWYGPDNPHARLRVDIMPGQFVQIRVRFAPSINVATPNIVPAANVNVPGYYFTRCLITHCHSETAVRDVIRFNFTARVSVEEDGDWGAITTPIGDTDGNAIGATAYSNSKFPTLQP